MWYIEIHNSTEHTRSENIEVGYIQIRTAIEITIPIKFIQQTDFLVIRVIQHSQDNNTIFAFLITTVCLTCLFGS